MYFPKPQRRLIPSVGFHARLWKTFCAQVEVGIETAALNWKNWRPAKCLSRCSGHIRGFFWPFSKFRLFLDHQPTCEFVPMQLYYKLLVEKWTWAQHSSKWSCNDPSGFSIGVWKCVYDFLISRSYLSLVCECWRVWVVEKLQRCFINAVYLPFTLQIINHWIVLVKTADYLLLSHYSVRHFVLSLVNLCVCRPGSLLLSYQSHPVTSVHQTQEQLACCQQTARGWDGFAFPVSSLPPSWQKSHSDDFISHRCLNLKEAEIQICCFSARNEA